MCRVHTATTARTGPATSMSFYGLGPGPAGSGGGGGVCRQGTNPTPPTAPKSEVDPGNRSKTQRNHGKAKETHRNRQKLWDPGPTPAGGGGGAVGGQEGGRRGRAGAGHAGARRVEVNLAAQTGPAKSMVLKLFRHGRWGAHRPAGGPRGPSVGLPSPPRGLRDLPQTKAQT